MPTFKPIIRGYKRSDGKCRIYIRVIQKRKVLYIPTDYYIEEKYFKDGKSTGAYSLQNKLNKALYNLLLEYEGIVLDQGSAIRTMDVHTLVTKLSGKDDTDFVKFTEKKVKSLQEEGRAGYAMSFQAMVNKLKEYSGTTGFNKMNLEFLTGFLNYLKLKVGGNTARIYLGRLKTIFYLARDNEVIHFDLGYLNKLKAKKAIIQKRGLSLNEVKRILIGPYPKAQQKAVDLWKLSLYLCGANLIDLATITPDKVYHSRLHYGRSKTDYPFSVKIVSPAQEILDKYKGVKYLLDLLDSDDSREHYHSVRTSVNVQLRNAVSHKITFYSARHSFATIAFNDCGFSEDHIDFAMGHKNSGHDMTDVYIKKRLDIVDEVQGKVMELLR